MTRQVAYVRFRRQSGQTGTCRFDRVGRLLTYGRMTHPLGAAQEGCHNAQIWYFSARMGVIPDADYEPRSFAARVGAFYR